MTFSQKYPHLAWWIDNHGYIEMGTDPNTDSLIRLYDEGGLWWEDDDDSLPIDDALANAEAALKTELPERFGDYFSL